MLHLLAWIIFLFRETWWDKNDKINYVNNKDCILDVASQKQTEDVKGKVTEEIISESNIYQDEDSLDDILRDTSWKAVDGSLHTDSCTNIEETNGFFIVNRQPSYDQDPLIEANLLSNKVKRVNSFTESFGDVANGENVKKAFIVQRSDSIQETNQSQDHPGHGTIKSFECSPKSPDDGKATRYQKRRNKYKGKNYAEEDTNEENSSSVLHSETPENSTSYPADDNVHQNSGNVNQTVEFDSRKAVLAKNNESTVTFGLSQRFNEKLEVDQKQRSEEVKTFVSVNQVDLSKNQPNDNKKTKVTMRVGLSTKDEGTREERDESTREDDVDGKIFVETATETDSSIRRNDSWDALDMNPARGMRPDEARNTIKDGSHAEGMSPNKLKDFGKTKAVTQFDNDSPKAVYNDFEAIMHRRKLHTDTMQKISDTFGNFGNREDKIFGAGSPEKRVSKNWRKVRQAVRSNRYRLIGKETPIN